MKAILMAAAAIFLTAAYSYPLTQPDISAIGDFRAYTGNWKNLDGAKTSKNGTLNMSFEELELAVAGYLNPYAKAWVTLSTPGNGLEIEEAYGDIFKGLPLKAELKAGQYLVDFGKLNTFHAHAFPFIERPLVHQALLGPDGFRDQGVNISFLLPLPVYSKLSLNILRGSIFSQGDTLADTLTHRNSQLPIYSGRWNLFLPIGSKGDLDVGLSGLFGRYKGKGAYGTGDAPDGFRNLNAVMGAFDAKYKIRWSDYTSLIVQGEYIINRRDLFTQSFTHVTNGGGFAFFDYTFLKRYDLGAMFDRAPGIFDGNAARFGQSLPDSLNNTSRAVLDNKNYSTDITVFGGFALLEETTLIRLSAQYTSYHISDQSLLANTSLKSKDSELTIMAQLIWSMGPHKPHEF
ncbi:MAG TPA: hypothetical protein VMS71_05010 [Candidatus Acidoferrum sp.]|nr:hypothetical protein [Candidatus Acidoferrum sp.]